MIEGQSNRLCSKQWPYRPRPDSAPLPVDITTGVFDFSPQFASFIRRQYCSPVLPHVIVALTRGSLGLTIGRATLRFTHAPVVTPPHVITLNTYVFRAFIAASLRLCFRQRTQQQGKRQNQGKKEGQRIATHGT